MHLELNMAKKVISIIEDDDGVIIDIRTPGHRATYEFENLNQALDALPNLDELQTGDL